MGKGSLSLLCISILLTPEKNTSDFIKYLRLYDVLEISTNQAIFKYMCLKHVLNPMLIVTNKALCQIQPEDYVHLHYQRYQ